MQPRLGEASMCNHARWCWVVGSALLVALSACSKHPTGSPESAASPAARHPAGATLAIAGDRFTGDDPAAIRAYLQTVREVKPTSFDVEWNPATVAVSRDAGAWGQRGGGRSRRVWWVPSSSPDRLSSPTDSRKIPARPVTLASVSALTACRHSGLRSESLDDWHLAS
jgi:hypothetical protein